MTENPRAGHLGTSLCLWESLPADDEQRAAEGARTAPSCRGSPGGRVDLGLAGGDLVLLGGLQVLVRLLVGRLLLLGGGEVGLEGLLHLREDAEDLAGLRGVGLLEGGLRVEVISPAATG